MKALGVIGFVALLVLTACDAGPSAVLHDPAVQDDAEASMAIIDGSDGRPPQPGADTSSR